MKFKYKKMSDGLVRPIISVEISYKKTQLRLSALVDSGADFCLFPAIIGEQLGIDVKSGTKGTIYGVTGHPRDYWLHDVHLAVSPNVKNGYLFDPVKFQAKVGFMESLNNGVFSLLGRKSFFEQFIVKFVEKHSEVELKIWE